MPVSFTSRAGCAPLVVILAAWLGLVACAGDDPLDRDAAPPTIRLEATAPAGPSATPIPAKPEQPAETPTPDTTAEPEQPTYTPAPRPTKRSAAAPTPVLPRPAYDVSVPFSELIKPHFFAQDAGGNLVAARGEPELILDYQGSIKIKLDDGGIAKYLDLLALESERIGEHPAHKIFRLEAMGVAVAPEVGRKIQPDHFDNDLFHRLDFEYQRGRETGGIIAELFHDGTFLVITPGTPGEWRSSREGIAEPTLFHVQPRALSAATSQLAQEYESEILNLPYDDQRYPPPALARKQCDLYRESLEYGPYRELLHSVGFRFAVSDEPGEPSGGATSFGQRFASLIRRGSGGDTRYFGMGSQWLGHLLRQMEVPGLGNAILRAGPEATKRREIRKTATT